jgi:hypothetical protein
VTGPLAARLAALYRVLLTGGDVRLEEHRDVDHEPHTGSGHHAENNSAHRAYFFVHLFSPALEMSGTETLPTTGNSQETGKMGPE